MFYVRQSSSSFGWTLDGARYHSLLQVRKIQCCVQSIPASIIHYSLREAAPGSGHLPRDSIASTDGTPLLALSTRLLDMSSDRCSLNQNHPNPFNPETTIEFTLGLDGPTRLEVINAAGARVALLVDEYLPAGRFVARWNASELPSGICYYRLVSGEWSQINRMMVVK